MTNGEELGSSWYCAALRRELPPGGDLDRAFCGRRLRLSASADGTVGATLEGHPAPVRLQDDVVFVWHGPAGQDPTYELPRLDPGGFTRSTYDSLEVRTSPSLVMRDLADYEHFETVHHYNRVSIDEPFSTDGTRCALTFSFDWPLILGSGLVTTRAHAHSACHGLGYQLTTVTSVGGTFVTRHRVMPTPTESGVTRVTLGMEIQVRSAPAVLPKIDTLGHAFARRAFVRDTATDAKGWQSASVNEAAEAHGTLATYWLWAKQFRAASAGPERTSWSC